MGRQAGSTRIDQVMAAIRARIAARAYGPGTRLPSVRAQAKVMPVSYTHLTLPTTERV